MSSILNDELEDFVFDFNSSIDVFVLIDGELNEDDEDDAINDLGDNDDDVLSVKVFELFLFVFEVDFGEPIDIMFCEKYFQSLFFE